MKFIVALFTFILLLSFGSFAQEKSCCSSGDHSKKEVSIEKSINKDGKTIEIKETVMRDGKTVEVKKVINEEGKKDGCCSSNQEIKTSTSDKSKDCKTKDVTLSKSGCCSNELKAENKVEAEKK